MNKINEIPKIGKSMDVSGDKSAAADSFQSAFTSDEGLVEVNHRMASRRMWLARGVAVASPVVASLVSTPVYAAAGACIMATAFGSQATTLNSRNPAAGQGVCTTQGPQYWLSGFPNSWPNGNPNPRNSTFSEIFGPLESGMTDKTKLNEVLSNMSYSLLAKYSVAAYLNALMGLPGFPLTATQAIAVYQSYRPVVSVKPPLVATWNEAQTVAWLLILMS